VHGQVFKFGNLAVDVVERVRMGDEQYFDADSELHSDPHAGHAVAPQ
jgi:hypothetical protein